MSTAQHQVLSQLAGLIDAIKRPHPLRVAIDGVDGAGKTILADSLVPLVEKHGRPVIRASVDGFHNPRALRYQRGVLSPVGYYRDSFNYEHLQQDLLIPLGPSGTRKYRPAAFNLKENTPICENWLEAPNNAVLLFDGVFLLRPTLIQYWDFSIWLEIDLNLSLSRAMQRDLEGYDIKEKERIRERYHRRYKPGQQLYIHEAKPRERASIIVDNNDYQKPNLMSVHARPVRNKDVGCVLGRFHRPKTHPT